MPGRAEGAARGVERRRRALGDGGGQQHGRARLGARVPGGRRLGLGRVGLEVEQHGRDVHARDAVDERVVGLGDQREAVLADAVDQPQLPQRLRAVQPLGEDPPRQAAQLLLARRLRQRRVAHVVVGVEVRVVDPDGAALHERRPGELLAVARHQVQALLELGHEFLVGRRLALEDQHGSDVHVRAAALEGQEGRVESAQPVGIRHAPDSPSRPMFVYLQQCVQCSSTT
jgi:hypothetical protein